MDCVDHIQVDLDRYLVLLALPKVSSFDEEILEPIHPSTGCTYSADVLRENIWNKMIRMIELKKIMNFLTGWIENVHVV